MKKSQIPVDIFYKCIVLLHFFIVFAFSDEEHTLKPSLPKADSSAPTSSSEQHCQVDPGKISSIVSRDSKSVDPALISLLSNTACEVLGDRILDEVNKYPIQWTKVKLFDFPNFSVLAKDATKRQLLKNILEKNTKVWALQTELNAEQMLEVTSQLSVLSQTAARTVLIELAKTKVMEVPAGKNQGILVANMIEEYGLNQGLIKENFLDTVEEMAVLSQTDSLSKLFISLSKAVLYDRNFAGFYDETSLALKVGVEKAAAIYPPAAKWSMIKSLMKMLNANQVDPDAFNNSSEAFNGASELLLKDEKVRQKILSQLWVNLIQYLSITSTHDSLATFVAESLTPEILFISPKKREILSKACQFYPPLAQSVQFNIGASWEKFNVSSATGGVKKSRMNRVKKSYLTPWISKVMDFPPAHISSDFLTLFLEQNLISDSILQAKFPGLILHYYKQTPISEIVETGFEPTVTSMAEQFRLSWNISSMLLPVLLEWAERNQ